MYETINPSNVVMYAIRHYNNPQCEGEKEFEDDLKRFKYIKRLLRKYHDTGILKERLLLNHLIVLQTCLIRHHVLHYYCIKYKKNTGQHSSHFLFS